MLVTTMIKTILVPTDGSDHAKEAISLACDLASKYDARIVFLHVLLRGALASELRNTINIAKLPDPIRDDFDRFEGLQSSGVAVASGYGSFPVTVPLPDEVLVAVGNALLEDAEARAKSVGVKEVGLEIKQGDPAECILATIGEESADFVVMGSRGLSDLKGLLMGSVSHKVSHLAPCTCVTVK